MQILVTTQSRNYDYSFFVVIKQEYIDSVYRYGVINHKTQTYANSLMKITGLY